MKTKLIIGVILFFTFTSTNMAQEITSNKKSIKISNTPKLIIEKVELADKDNNQVIEAGENCSFQLYIKNKGVGSAKSVKIATSVVEGSAPGLTYEELKYIGKLTGKQTIKVEIPISPGLKVNDGIIKFKFIAQEANAYNSEPAFYDLQLKGKNKDVDLAISWYYPLTNETEVGEKEYKLKACIASSSPLKDIQLYINSKVAINNRGLIPANSNECDYLFEKDILLNQGVNEIKLIISNQSSTIEAPARIIKFIQKELEHRNALIIGNSKYKISPLRNPANDAKAMAAALRKLNFDVIEVIDGDKKKMKESVRKFYKQLQEERGVGLFYYAGHGVQVKGENYLIPINSDIQEEFDIPDEAVRMNNVLSYMENSGSRMNIVILDACRDNPFARSFRSGSRGLAQIYAEGSGSIIAYATSPGSIASDGSGENGLYTQELLKAIEIPGLEIGMVFRKVLSNVKKLSDGKQIPWTNSSIEGEFYFKK